MNREEASKYWIEYVRGELDDELINDMNAFLEANPDVRKEFEELGELWGQMDTIKVPEPSGEMDIKFQSMLKGYEIAQSNRPDVLATLRNFVASLFENRLSLASMMLVLGLAFGFLLNQDRGANDQLSALNSEIYEMKKMMMFTLLEQPKALDRMKAVQISSEIVQPDEKIMEALLTTLNNDPNVNVRLVALQSLAGLASNPKVRTGLIASISNQTSPVIQNALADLMIDLMEKNAVEQFEKLLQQQNLDTLIKEKIHTTLETLI